MARADEHNGDMKDAEDHFNQAVSIDPDYLPAVLSLAQIANDRGDVLALSRWLKRAGDEADPNLHRLAAQYQPIVRKDAARNAPCPCGSGKKFKQCHMRQTQHPLTDRALWLYHKALMYQDTEHRDVVLPLAQARVKYSDDPMAMLRSLEDEFVLGTALFEGGVFDQFVALRGSLLPEDELLTAQQWLLTDLSVFEVQSVQPGQGFRLRDLRTGETHQIDEKLGSRKFRRGQYLCTRVMPVAATRQIIGGLEPVAMHLRDPLMELLDEDPDPSEIIDLLSTRFAPPQVQTTEGEKMVICEATITTAHSDRIAAAFSERFRSTEPDTWIEEVEVMGVDRVRGTFHLAGDQLAISTNSVERMNRSLALIKDLDPTHQITSNTKKPMDLTKAARMGNSATSPSPSPEPMDLSANPEIAQALSDMMRKHEDAWVDESIPALDGHTPRQAVADPTRRDDVIRLLDSFPPANGNPGAMDPDRMRSLLGL